MNTQLQPRGGGLDRGATLLEILIAVVLLGSVGVGVLASLAAAATGASVQRSIATAQTSLATAGDVIVAEAEDYVSCAAASASEIAAAYEETIDAIEVEVAGESGSQVDVVSVAFWNGTAFGDDCRVVDGHRLQRIELQTTVRNETSTLTVVKRPTEAPTANLGPLPSGGGGGDAAVDGSASVEITPGVDG